MEILELALRKEFVLIYVHNGMMLAKIVFSTNLMKERGWISVMKQTRKMVNVFKQMKSLQVQENSADFQITKYTKKEIVMMELQKLQLYL